MGLERTDVQAGMDSRPPSARAIRIIWASAVYLSMVLWLARAAIPAHAEEYVAFSLRVAQQRIEAAGTTDWRKEQPEVFTLGGITRIRGVVYDHKGNDVILVGQRDPKRPILTLDDFAVALRARFIHNEWPLVSIDPTPDTKRTNMQYVRYEGGIENSQFGLDMFDADLRLKKIDQGHLQSGAVGLKGTWDMHIERMGLGEGHRQEEISARFWFYPVSSSVTVREDVVAIESLRVGVFTEVLSASFDGKAIADARKFVDPINDEFAKQLSERYEEVAAAHPSIARLVGLNELVALTRAVEEIDPKPDLSYWLTKYQVRPAATPREQEVLKRHRDYHAGNVAGYLEMSGGVKLTAVALRLQAGDVSALREAVVGTRLGAQQLVWGFRAEQWGIAAPTDAMSHSAETATLFAQAAFLYGQRRYDDTIMLYDRALQLEQNSVDGWSNKGVVLGKLGRQVEAVKCFDRALEINSRLAEVWSNKAVALSDLGRPVEALECLDRALDINPQLAGAWSNKGLALGKLGRWDEALKCYDRALEISPRHAEAWCGKSAVLQTLGRLEEALKCCDSALEANPQLAGAWSNKGAALGKLGRGDEALRCHDRALEIDPGHPESWANKGVTLADLGRRDEALKCFDRALEINPALSVVWDNKGQVLALAGRLEEALKCYDSALEASPQFAGAWSNKGATLERLGQSEENIRCQNRALEINPRLVSAWCNKGVALGNQGHLEEALKCFDSALEIDSRYAQAWYNKGVALYHLKRHVEARQALEKAAELGHADARRALEIMQ